MEREYILQTGNDVAREQVHCLETVLDPYSTEYLDAVGLMPGYRCLDVGSGGGSITRWLAGRVGPLGRVTSIDLEPGCLVDHSGVDWKRHDINDGVPDGGPFDVIHIRLVLMHLSRREEILRDLVKALKPGGWLVVGDFKGPPLTVVSAPSPEDEGLFHEVQRVGTGVIGVQAGISYTWAEEIDANMTAAGLANVRSGSFASVDAGGSPGCLLHRNYSVQLEEPLKRHGFTDVDLKRYRELMMDPNFRVWMYTFYLSRGQRPRD